MASNPSSPDVSIREDTDARFHRKRPDSSGNDVSNQIAVLECKRFYIRRIRYIKRIWSPPTDHELPPVPLATNLHASSFWFIKHRPFARTQQT